MKTLMVAVAFSIIGVGCSVTNQIVLPNGQKGLVVDCSNSFWSECFMSAGELCPKGYDIYERTKDEFTESKLPITELPKRVENKDSSLLIGDTKPQMIIRKDKYMVIACAV